MTTELFLLDKDAILGMTDIQMEPLVIPEWNNGTIYIRALTGAQRDKFESSMIKMRQDGKKEVTSDNFRARLCVMCIVDANGKRLFRDDEAAALGKKNAAAIARIYDKASEMSGLTQKDADEILGNSDGVTGADSFSG
jgi:hypothetical protein